MCYRLLNSTIYTGALSKNVCNNTDNKGNRAGPACVCTAEIFMILGNAIGWLSSMLYQLSPSVTLVDCGHCGVIKKRKYSSFWKSTFGQNLSPNSSRFAALLIFVVQYCHITDSAAQILRLSLQDWLVGCRESVGQWTAACTYLLIHCLVGYTVMLTEKKQGLNTDIMANKNFIRATLTLTFDP